MASVTDWDVEWQYQEWTLMLSLKISGPGELSHEARAGNQANWQSGLRRPQENSK